MPRLRSLAILTVLTTIVVMLPVLPAGGEPPTARAIARDVGGWSASADEGVRTLSVDTWQVSEETPADGVVLLGAEWSGDDVELEVRTRSALRWSPWRELHRDVDDAPDPDSAEGMRVDADVSEPIWVGRVDALQFRTRGPQLPQVTLHGVAIDERLDFTPPEARSGAAHAAAAKPTIIPRSSWDPNGQCQRQGPPRYSDDVRFAVVHHTADSNDYSESQAAARLLSVCLYHVRSRGYDDVAYNFFVDKYGRTYEGRTGGIEEPVIGGHALGFNGGSTGVSLLGTYESFEPPPAARAALRDLLAWKLDVHHVDPLGTTTERSGADTGPYDRGELATLPTIIGHRDVRSTACPGTAAYRMISSAWLQTEVDAAGGTRIFSDLPARIDQPVIGERLPIRARISDSTPWNLSITDASGSVVRSTSGQSQDIDLRWDMRAGDGREVTPGRYEIRLTAGSARPLTSTVTVHAAARRHAGEQAPGTAAALSRWVVNEPQRAAAGWSQTETVVIGSTQGDIGLSAAPALASSYGAPLLLTDPPRLTPATADEIRRVGATRAIIVGRTDEVSATVESDLKHVGITSVERIAGEEAQQTAARVAWRVVERRSPGDIVLVAASGPNGASVAGESVAAAGYASIRGLPLVLVQPDGLPESTRWVLEQRQWSRVTLVGGQGVVASSVKDAIRQAAGDAPLVELAGADRHLTARAVTEDLTARRTPSSDPHHRDPGLAVTVAAGTSTLDGYAASAAAARWGGVLLLVDPGGLPSPSRSWLEARAAQITLAAIAGGPASVPEAVRTEIETIVRSEGPHRAAIETWEAAGPPPPESRFDDIDGNTHRESIERVAEEGIAHGCTETSYCPDRSVTRAQMASFIARAKGLEPVAGQRFSDVPPDHPHAPTVNAIVEEGIAGGYRDGTYKPEEPVTRAQMATFLQRALALEPVDGSRFSDVPADHVHARAINAIVDAGVTQGCGSDRYCPEAAVSRAQMATFLSNALDRGL